MGPDPVQRDRCRLLHDIAELTREDKLPISSHLGGLNDHDLAPNGGPCEADCNSNLPEPIAQNVFENCRLQMVVKCLNGYKLLQLILLKIYFLPLCGNTAICLTPQHQTQLV